MKYLIKIFSSFGNEKNFKFIYENICQTHLIKEYGYDKDIYITNEDNYTHAILINTPMPNLNKNILKENVIGFAFEPPEFLNLNKQFIEYAIKNIGKYYIGSSNNLPKPFIEGFSFMFHNSILSNIPIKNKLMSIIFSEKLISFGHKYRHTLVKYILIYKLPIDIYGRGCNLYKEIKNKKLKGEFNEREPYLNYKFSICIENFKTNEYFSEKIMDPIINYTIPIYYGANNITKYFNNMVIILTGNIDEDIKIIIDVINNQDYYLNTYKINIKEATDNINLIKNINKIF